MKRHIYPFPLYLIFLAAIAGFSCSEGSKNQGGTEGNLVCPEPVQLPFQLDSSTFQNPARAAQAKGYGRPLHVFFDFIGHEGEAQTLGGITNYGGTLSIHGLSEEYVSVWARDDNQHWTKLTRVKTDLEGKFSAEIPAGREFGAGARPVYAVVEGDQTCARGGIFVFPSGTGAIVTDIDGTLTVNDAEVYKQMDDPNYVAVAYGGAIEMLNLYAGKGYQIMYLTARPYHLRSLTRVWLDQMEAPFGYVETADSFVGGETARAYKRGFLERIMNDLGYQVAAAYGNASTDQEAYEDVAIPAARVFIIGPEAGIYGTVIQGDYAQHITSFVQNFPGPGE
ncbi:MAG: hypothetical protein NT009_06675 [Proteobacteria bacterium]|nr:hypothetical protein [Pseudomonadota bacterium]